MTRHGIERLPVVDEKDRLVDIVTRRDLLSLRHTLQTGPLLRSQDPAGVQQEL